MDLKTKQNKKLKPWDSPLELPLSWDLALPLALARSFIPKGQCHLCLQDKCPSQQPSTTTSFGLEHTTPAWFEK